MQGRLLLGENGPRHGTDLQADAAIDTGIEIDPIKARALKVRPLTWVDAGHRTGIDAVGHAFTHTSVTMVWAMAQKIDYLASQ